MRAKGVLLNSRELVPVYWRCVHDHEIAEHEKLVRSVVRKFRMHDGRCTLDPVLGEDDMAQECRLKIFLLLSLQRRVTYTALYNHLRDYADKTYRHAERDGTEA